MDKPWISEGNFSTASSAPDLVHVEPNEENQVLDRGLLQTAIGFPQDEHVSIGTDSAIAGDVGPLECQPRTREGWVYFAQAQSGGPVKIGFAVDPESRLVQLQVGSPVRLWFLGRVPGTPADEREIHGRLADCAAHGERKP